MNERVEEVDGLVAGKDGVVGAVCGLGFGTLHSREGIWVLLGGCCCGDDFYERLEDLISSV